MMTEGAAKTSSYSDKEFKLALDVMDQVDRLRQAEPQGLDVDKAIGLVRRTYQHQGIPVVEAVLEKAVKLALAAFPEPAPLPAVVSSSRPVRRRPFRDWLFGLKKEEAVVCQPTPLDKANGHVRELVQHRLMHDSDLSAVLAQEWESLGKWKHALLRKALRWVWLPLPVLAGSVGTMVTLVPIASAVPWSMLLATSVASGAVSLGMACSFFQKRAWLFDEDFQHLRYAKEAIANRDFDSLFLRKAVTEHKGWQHISYYCHLVSTEDQSSWEHVTRVAMEDPLLAKTWASWLASDAPIRRGDTELLLATAQAIKAAKRWLVHCHQMEFPVQAQARLRSRSMEQLGLPALLDAPEPDFQQDAAR